MDAQLAIWKNETDSHDTDKVLARKAGGFFSKARPKGTWRRSRQGGRGGKKRKKLLSSSPPPLFWRVNLFLGINFWLAPTLGQSKVPIDRTAKYACFAGQHSPFRRALICWLQFCINRAFEVLADLQDPVSPLGGVCVFQGKQYI